MPSPLTVELIRHGRTAWNVERRFLGGTDVPLDEVGLAEASRLGPTLGPVDAIWSSPLQRARQTAAALIGPQPALTHPGLTEMHMGELEGLGPADAMARYPAVLLAWRDDPSAIVPPGGDAMADVRDRAVRAWEQIVAQAGGATRIAIVTHQIALGGLLCALHRQPLSAIRTYFHRNTAWTTIRVGPDGTEVVAMNQGPHLD